MNKQQLAQMLREHDICPTGQRLAVYEYLLTHRIHPTADTVYRALAKQNPSFSRTTVYNTAKALAQAGLLRIISIENEEQRFDITLTPHGHFRCTVCGGVEDVPLDESLCAVLCPMGCDVATLEVNTTGVCRSCKQTNQENQ